MERLHITFTAAVVLLVLWLLVIVSFAVAALITALVWHLSGVVVGSIIIVGSLIAVFGLVGRRWIVVEREIKISDYYGKDEQPTPQPRDSVVTTV